MREMRFSVDVTLARVPVANRWISDRWQPVEVVAATEPAADAPEYRCDSDDASRWTAKGVSVLLHPTEAEGYFLNITAPEPKLFVMWRRAEDGELPPVQVVVVTASYNEAARSLDGGEQVDSLPLPREVAAWLQRYVAEHYKPEPRRKVRRNDPFAGDVPPRGHQDPPASQ